MRSPSARVLINTCDIYIAPDGRDTAGGLLYPYPTTPTVRGVRCTAQPQRYSEDDSQERVTELVEWKVMFGSPQNLSPKDKIIVTDLSGVQHILIVEASRDEAGRGAAFTVRATEKI